jgi:hypothetical protein
LLDNNAKIAIERVLAVISSEYYNNNSPSGTKACP